MKNKCILLSILTLMIACKNQKQETKSNKTTIALNYPETKTEDTVDT